MGKRTKGAAMSYFSELNDALMKAAKEIYVPMMLASQLERGCPVAEMLGIAQKGNGAIRLTIKE